MEILINYTLIGLIFTFLIDVILSWPRLQNHPKVSKILEKEGWGWIERILLILIWPLGLANFIYGFIKEYFRK